jgi:hypothetical protein
VIGTANSAADTDNRGAWTTLHLDGAFARDVVVQAGRLETWQAAEVEGMNRTRNVVDTGGEQDVHRDEGLRMSLCVDA